MNIRIIRPTALAVVLAGLAISLASCGGGNTRFEQPAIGARQKAVLTLDGYQFRDSNGNGKLDAYEDWRLAADARAADLVARMPLDATVGLIRIHTSNPNY